MYQLSLPTLRLQNFHYDLTELPPGLLHISFQCWVRLVGILRSSTPALPGGGNIFVHPQRALGQPSGNLRLVRRSHTGLVEWCNLEVNLETCPTHLLEVVPPATTWHMMNGSCQWGLERFFCGLIQRPLARAVHHVPRGGPRDHL